MRRRENLKPLSVGRLANASSGSQRGFFHTKFVPPARVAAKTARMAMRLPAAHVAGGVHGFFPPKASANNPELPPKIASAIQFAVQRRPQLPADRPARASAARVRQAPDVRRARRSAKRSPSRRDFGMARSSARRPELGSHKLQTASVRLPGTSASARAATKSAPARGNALRVSFTCRFRLRTVPKRAPRPIAAAAAGRLQFSQKRYRLAPKPWGSAAPKLCSAIIPIADTLSPPAPGPANFSSRFEPRTVAAKRRSPSPGTPPAARSQELGWVVSTDRVLLHEIVPRNWKPGQTEARPHIAVKPSPLRGRGQSKCTLAPFVPQDMPCGYSFNVGQNGSKDLKR